MESLSLLWGGLLQALTWPKLLYCIIGVTIGQLVGILPGLGPVAGTAMLIPLTYGLEPTSAIVMLAGIYYGAMYGGTITSVLINTPGEAASVVTCIDGYALAKKGRAGVALGVSAVGSFFGGMVAVMGLALIGPPIAEFALEVGPPEFFGLMMVGLMMVIGLMGKSVVRGLMAAIFGLILSLVGLDQFSGEVRLTFGQVSLLNGVNFVAVAMGLFGVSEILTNLADKQNVTPPEKVKGFLPYKNELVPTAKAICRGTGIGFLIGLIPGASAVIASLTSYVLEKRISKAPERFGNGAIEGVAGPETANNACAGSALIPLLTLGIPSSPTVAVLMGAFIVHGLQPGPNLFRQHGEFVWAVIASMVVGNLILLLMNLPLANMWAKVTQIPYKILFPLIIIITVVGVYTINRSLFDIGLMIAFGIIGYFMKKLDFPIAATVLTLALGSQIEFAFLQSLAISRGNPSIFFTRPAAAMLLGIALIIFVFSVIGGLRNKKNMFSSDSEI